MAQTWREALQEKPAEEWLSSVSMGIPEHIKKALGGLRPPTWVELESLPLIDTNDAGVYARLVTSRHQIQMVSDRYLYVGSASKYGGGLNWRIAQHIRKTKLKHESRLQYDIRTKRLKGNGRFVTLMVMKMDSSENEVVLHVRKTVILAEAILTVWLSALRSPSHDFQSVCPWDSQTLQYTGWASHNPLMDDVVLPGKHSQRQNQDRGH
jgi:Uri superfamily endonuclease